MRKRKVRGKKRLFRMVKHRLLEATSIFPSIFHYGIHSLKLPANQAFIEGLNENGKRYIADALLEGAMTLKRLKPHAKYKIVVLYFPENLFRSELLIFEDEQSYQQFLAKHIWDWCEIETLAPVIRYRHWTQKVFMECLDEELEQPIICYIER